MKCLFDTNVYISFIRDRSHSAELQWRGTVKYLSAIVLMELWAGAKAKKAKKLINQLQKPYVRAGRIVTLSANNYIATGQFFADLSIQTPDFYVQRPNLFLKDVRLPLNPSKESLCTTQMSKRRKVFRRA